jgi:hypothetical protein
MRNYNPAYDRGDPLQSSKFLSTIIRTVDLNKTAFIQLSEFSVSEWWIKDFDIRANMLRRNSPMSSV